MRQKGGTTEREGWALYIPSGVKTDNELFNGFGKRELMQSVIGSLFGGALAAVIWLFAKRIMLPI